jgi:MurNAc alpha-1-phosphate uridylyltransferase
MSAVPKTAMVLAAGLGTRMKPLTDSMSKAMIEIGGKALIDHTLDRLADVGVETAVVNVHYLADQLEDHLAARTRPRMVISDERAGLLDSGGGIMLAAPYLGRDPIFVANIDNIWIEGQTSALQTLVEAWNPDLMDILILLAPRAATYGYERPEGFIRDDAGRLTHANNPNPPPPYNNIGFQILKPSVLDGQPKGQPFSILPIWKDLSARGRLFGAVMDGEVIHVSDPAGRDYAQARLRDALG